MTIPHTPVLLREACDFLDVRKGRKYIDATLGMGGHSEEIVKRGGIVLGLETDQSTVEIAGKRLAGIPVTIVHANFTTIDRVAKENGFNCVSGILFDLGVSSAQLTSGVRGMSFSNPDAPLDMRLDPATQGITASDLLNSLRVDQLTEALKVTMPVYEARKLALNIVKRREVKKFALVSDLLDLLGERKGKLHQGTKEFLALRIAVNSELANLSEALPKAFELLDSQGRLVVISFHSGEDRIVKEFFKNMGGTGKAIILTKDAVKPSEDELRINKRARSAVMRVLEKI